MVSDQVFDHTWQVVRRARTRGPGASAAQPADDGRAAAAGVSGRSGAGASDATHGQRAFPDCFDDPHAPKRISRSD